MRSCALWGATAGDGELTQCSTPLTFLGTSSTLAARISITLPAASFFTPVHVMWNA